MNRPPVAEPAWEIATLFPDQGAWTEADYLALETSRLVEFVEGRVEVLPMPSLRHQRIAARLFESLRRFATDLDLGEVLFAPTRLRVAPGRFREPDVLFVSGSRAGQETAEYLAGADLVIEVVSPSDPQRDLETKRVEYAAAGIAEYWIVDPRDESVTVLSLAEGAEAYAESARQTEGTVRSVLLPEFALSLDDLFGRRPRAFE